MVNLFKDSRQMQRIFQNADLDTKQKIETLINGGTVKAELHEEILCADVQTKTDGIWNMLCLRAI